MNECVIEYTSKCDIKFSCKVFIRKTTLIRIPFQFLLGFGTSDRRYLKAMDKAWSRKSNIHLFFEKEELILCSPGVVGVLRLILTLFVAYKTKLIAEFKALEHFRWLDGKAWK